MINLFIESHTEVGALALSADEWKWVNTVKLALDPFWEQTQTTSLESATLTSTLPVYWYVSDHLDDIIKGRKRQWRDIDPVIIQGARAGKIFPLLKLSIS